jgi:PAS domain S-box-containing protein
MLRVDATGHPTAQASRDMRSSPEIKAEIQERLGFVPAFFEPAEPVPALLESLWQQSRASYFDNPLPAVFKERAAACVALQSRVLYALQHHCCALRALGASGSEILRLLEGAGSLSAARMDEHVALLASCPDRLAVWPEPESPLERALLAAVAVDFADPRLAPAVRPHLVRILGPEEHAHWVAFLGYLHVFQQWVLSHPELWHRRDEPVQACLPGLLAEEPGVARFLAPRDPGPDAAPGSRAAPEPMAGPRLAALVDAAMLAIIETDRIGVIQFASAHTAQIFGHAPEDLIGRPIEALIPERYARAHEGLRQGFLAAPSVRTMGGLRTVHGLHRDGREMPLEIGLAPTSSGGAVATIVDISARMPVQEALRRVGAARERLSRMFAGGMASDAMYHDVLDFLLELFDSEFGFFGYIDQHGSLVCPSMTRQVWDSYQVEDKAIVFPRNLWGGLWGRVLLEKRCLFKNEEHVVPAGHRPLHRSLGAPLLFGGELIGSLHVANRAWDYDEIDAQVMQAIADQMAPLLAARRAEDDLRRSNADLEQFASVASHDLQEPLRTVTSFAELLVKRYDSQLDERGKGYLRHVIEGAARMQRLVRDMLAVARPGGVKGSRARIAGHTNSSQIVDHVIEDLQASMDECGAQITRDELPELAMDRSQAAQLFKNLLGNAIKFRREEPPRVHVSAQRQGHQWLFSVSDNGIGIAPEHGDRIFQMFQRAQDPARYPGSGIGLAVAKRIVERHGGRIWFESRLGQGTTFYFVLPAQLR